MTLDTEDRQLRRNVSRLILSVRKERELTQATVAGWLGITRTGVAKVERGAQQLSLFQWGRFAEKTGLSCNSVFTGQFESRTPALLQDTSAPNPYALSPRYSRHRGTKIRALLPVISWAKKILDDEGFDSLMLSQKIDPLIFVNLENQVSYDFTQDLFVSLIRHAGLKLNGLESITAQVTEPKVHGSLHHFYDAQEDKIKLFKALANSCVYRECNYSYQVDSSNKYSLDISVVPHSHMWETNFISHFVLGDLTCRYRKSFFEHFVNYAKPGTNTPAVFKKMDCLHKGDKKCVYRLAL